MLIENLGSTGLPTVAADGGVKHGGESDLYFSTSMESMLLLCDFIYL